MNGIEHLQDWYRRVAQFGPLWRSLRLACICLRETDGWVVVSGQLALSLEEPDGDEAQPFLELDELAALSGRFPVEALPKVVSILETGLILSGSAYHPVKLPSASPQSGNWYPPQLWDRQQCENRLGVDFASLVSQYSDPTINEPIPQQLGYGIEERLKMGDPPYNGLGGLARSMGLDSFWSSRARWFRCVCPVPLRFGPVSRELRNRQVSVVVEASQTTALPEARVNGFVGDDAIRLGLLSEWEAIRGEDPAGTGAAPHARLTRYHKAVDVGQHDGGLRLALAYKGTVVEEREQLLSPRDPWPRACLFFDPEFARSKELVTTSGKIDAGRLELGVARLLALAGLRVAWFGRSSAEKKPDVLAYCESDEGRKTIALVECTEEDPARKIDKAAAWAEELQAWLNDPSCDVVSLVITAATLKDVDLKAAFQAGVKLAGADELADAWQNIDRGGTADEVLKALTEIDPLKHPDVFGL